MNMSIGLTADDPTATGLNALTVDGLAATHPSTTVVAAAGNSGPANNTVGGSGYNAIHVGALENNGSDLYDRVTSFSSRGPQDYADVGGAGLVESVRSPVDIAAPGNTMTLAYYGGTTGSNDSSFGGTADGSPDTYISNVEGTSVAAPLVTGSVALMHDAAISLSLPTTARDSRVMKVNLMNSADKVLQDDGSPWDNGQMRISDVITTTQAVDFQSGAGGLNLSTTFNQYLSGETDIEGLMGGTSDSAIGWDFAQIEGGPGSVTDIVLPTVFSATEKFTATLNWFRDRTSINSTTASDNAYSDLDLEVWDATFTTKYAESISDYNAVEHLYLDLPQATTVGLRVIHDEMRFGTQDTVNFAIAWSGVAVPEPGAFTLAITGLLWSFRRRR